MQQMIINIHFLDDQNVGWRKGVQRRAHQSSSSCHYGGHAVLCATLRVLFLNFDALAMLNWRVKRILCPIYNRSILTHIITN